MGNGVSTQAFRPAASAAVLLAAAWVLPSPEAVATTHRDSVTVAVAGDERVGIRLHANVVLAFSRDRFEGECHVGHKASAHMVKFSYHRSGSGERVRFRMPMRHVDGEWIPRRAISGDPMTPARARRSDLRQLDRCLRWMRPANPWLRNLKPLLK